MQELLELITKWGGSVAFEYDSPAHCIMIHYNVKKGPTQWGCTFHVADRQVANAIHLDAQLKLFAKELEMGLIKQGLAK